MKATAQNICAGLLWTGALGLCVTGHGAFLGLWAAAFLVGASISSPNAETSQPRGQTHE